MLPQPTRDEIKLRRENARLKERIKALEETLGVGEDEVAALQLVFGLIKLLYRLNAIEEWIPRIEGWNNSFVAVAALGIASLLFVVFFLLVRRVKEHASKLRRELTPRPLDKHQLLLLRSPGDEAVGFPCRLSVPVPAHREAVSFRRELAFEGRGSGKAAEKTLVDRGFCGSCGLWNLSFTLGCI
jgi:hypothetical protein